MEKLEVHRKLKLIFQGVDIIVTKFQLSHYYYYWQEIMFVILSIFVKASTSNLLNLTSKESLQEYLLFL